MIFEMAFQRPDSLQLTFKDRWDQQEENKRKSDFENYTPKPFPKHKVDDFMVSKRFFTLAAKAWFSAGEWTNLLISSGGRSLSGFLFDENGLFIQFTKKLRLRDPFFSDSTLLKMGELRELQIGINDFVFEEIEGRYAWEHELQESELANLSISKTLIQLHNLKSFTLSSARCRYANTDKKKETFERNVKALETAIKKGMESSNRNAAAHQTPKATGLTCTPLYYGSKVCSGCSKLHSSEHEQTMLNLGRVFKRRKRSKLVQKRRPIRTASIPETKEKILELVRSHTPQVTDFLFDLKQKYNAEKAEEWEDVDTEDDDQEMTYAHDAY